MTRRDDKATKARDDKATKALRRGHATAKAMRKAKSFDHYVQAMKAHVEAIKAYHDAMHDVSKTSA